MMNNAYNQMGGFRKAVGTARMHDPWQWELKEKPYGKVGSSVLFAPGSSW